MKPDPWILNRLYLRVPKRKSLPRHCRINCEEIDSLTKGYLKEVHYYSPIYWRKYLEEMAYYFKREQRYDGLQYSATSHNSEVPSDTAAFLFATRNYKRFKNIIPDDQNDVLIFGGCCFRYRQYLDHDPEWALQWVYLHPMVRKEGILSSCWGYFEKRFGTFLVETPLSLAMQAFILKHGCPDQEQYEYIKQNWINYAQPDRIELDE